MVYIVGGNHGEQYFTNNIWAFDLVKNDYAILTTIPAGIHNAAGFAQIGCTGIVTDEGDKAIALAGGWALAELGNWDTKQLDKSVRIYKVDLDEWSLYSLFPKKTAQNRLVFWNSRLFSFGGISEGDSSGSTKVFMLAPVNSEQLWKPLQDLPAKTNWPAVIPYSGGGGGNENHNRLDLVG